MDARTPELDATAPADVDTAAVALDAGAAIGRFTLLEPLGAGAMGVVWAAYDPQLDRKVALKFVRAQHAGPDMLERLRREAKALARVSHPNVVAIHDIGVDRDRIYIAQEFVRGRDLAAWLTEPRELREIVDVYVQAARGLAAAHAAGIVHRDFKPSNVLVGDDGRVRVADFGVARASDPEAATTDAVATPAPTPTPTPTPTPKLTATGGLVGTPLYMAPEQYLDAPADARSDQFSFCVSLAEGLYGEVPFAGTSAADYAIEVVKGNVRAAPSGTRVPARLRAIVLRGLAPDPAARFPAMTDLIAALEADPTRTRRRRTVTAIVIAAALGVGVVGFGLAYRARVEPCRGGGAQLAAVWNDPGKLAARAAFIATGAPGALDAWARAEAAVDRYGASWMAMHHEACEATTVRGEQSQDMLDRRMACLGERLQEVRATAELFGHADRLTVSRAGRVAAGLSSLSACADLAALGSVLPPPNNAIATAQVARVREDLATAHVLQGAGKFADALAAAVRARDSARVSSYEPATAEALVTLGQLQSITGDARTAEATLRDAYLSALASGDDHVALQAAAVSIAVVGKGAARPDDGAWWAEVARALLRKHDDPESAALIAINRAELDTARGRTDDAIAEYRTTLGLWTTLRGANSESVASLHINIGSMLAAEGKNDAALGELRAAVATMTAVSPDHPDLAGARFMIGTVLAQQGKYDEGLVELRAGLAAAERALGADHPQLAQMHGNVGVVLQRSGKNPEALVELQRSLAIAEKSLPPNHPLVVTARQNLADLLAAMGHTDEALAAYRLTLAHQDVASTGRTHRAIGTMLHAQHQDRDAIAELERAIAIDDQAHDAEAALARGELGQIDLDRGDLAHATELLRAAIAAIEASAADRDATLPELRFSLAQARWGANDHAGAVALARQARAEAAQLPGTASDLAEIDAWLAAHAK